MNNTAALKNNIENFDLLSGENSVDDSNSFHFPDWNLIDEISIALLEQGIGTFETLERALPSIVFANIQNITDDTIDDNKETDKNTNKKLWCCSTKHMLKLFRIAQLQLKYVLRTQHDLLNALSAEREKCKKIVAENKVYRRSILTSRRNRGNASPEKSEDKFYKCNSCEKVFLNSIFLYEHLRRKHPIEANSDLSSLTRQQNFNCVHCQPNASKHNYCTCRCCRTKDYMPQNDYNADVNKSSDRSQLSYVQPISRQTHANRQQIKKFSKSPEKSVSNDSDLIIEDNPKDHLAATQTNLRQSQHQLFLSSPKSSSQSSATSAWC